VPKKSRWYKFHQQNDLAMSLATIYRDTLNAEQRRSRADQFGRCGQRPAAIDLLPAIGSLLGRVFRASLATTGLRDIFGQPATLVKRLRSGESESERFWRGINLLCQPRYAASRRRTCSCVCSKSSRFRAPCPAAPRDFSCNRRERCQFVRTT
jgi:hypothetical protein